MMELAGIRILCLALILRIGDGASVDGAEPAGDHGGGDVGMGFKDGFYRFGMKIS